MKIVKIIINILLSFVLMLGIITSTLLVIVNNYIDKNKVINKFEEINLYNAVYEEIRNGFENYIYQSGLDINIIDKICTKEKVKNDILIVLNSMYGEGSSNIDSSEIHINLDNAIKEYIDKQGRKISKEEEKNIEKFEDLIEESYKEQIGIYQKGSNKISTKFSKIINYVKKFEIAFIGSSIFLLIILIIVNNKILYVAGSYTGISLLSSGILMILSKNIVNSKIDINNLVLFTKSLSNAVIHILNSILNSIQYMGSIYIVSGVVLIILMNCNTQYFAKKEKV